MHREGCFANGDTPYVQFMNIGDSFDSRNFLFDLFEVNPSWDTLKENINGGRNYPERGVDDDDTVVRLVSCSLY